MTSRLAVAGVESRTRAYVSTVFLLQFGNVVFFNLRGTGDPENATLNLHPTEGVSNVSMDQ